MEHWKNLSLEDIQEEVDGIVYTEEWVPIIGFEEYYDGSSFGRVKSKGRISLRGHKLRARILVQTIGSNKYLLLGLWKGGEQFEVRVHKIIAECFLPPDESRKYINHINGIKTDNRKINLERVTPSENNIHAYRVLNKKRGMKGKFGHLRVDSTPIRQFSIDGKHIATFDSVTLAAMGAKAEARNIRKCANVERNTAGGFCWKW